MFASSGAAAVPNPERGAAFCVLSFIFIPPMTNRAHFGRMDTTGSSSDRLVQGSPDGADVLHRLTHIPVLCRPLVGKPQLRASAKLRDSNEDLRTGRRNCKFRRVCLIGDAPASTAGDSQPARP